MIVISDAWPSASLLMAVCRRSWNRQRKPARLRAFRQINLQPPQLLNPYLGSPDNNVEIKRTDHTKTILRMVWRTLPRNGGRAVFLLCPFCAIPRRFVYGWKWDSFSGWSNKVRRTDWSCRACNWLRYSSEGGYLRPSGMFHSFGSLPRPESWFPYVFTFIHDPQLNQFLHSN